MEGRDIHTVGEGAVSPLVRETVVELLTLGLDNSQVYVAVALAAGNLVGNLADGPEDIENAVAVIRKVAHRAWLAQAQGGEA
jgi:U3 small nucleolar ribonucleoprotein component